MYKHSEDRGMSTNTLRYYNQLQIWLSLFYLTHVFPHASKSQNLLFSKDSLKGLFTNFEYIKIFLCPYKRNIFDKTTLTRNNWEKWCSKSVCVLYITYITVLGRTDFQHIIFSIISNQIDKVSNTYVYL